MRFIILISFIITIVLSCVDPYQPPYAPGNTNILVVDGLLNSTDQSATVRLTRAVTLSSTNAPAPEIKASVFIEIQGGGSIPLFENGNGIYTATGLALNNSKQYKLKIITSSGTHYASDYVTLQQTPPIDSVRWEASADGVHIYVNTHDPSGLAQYYRWNYTETWQYNSVYNSSVKLVDGIVYPREPTENIYDCWRSAPSTDIMISSTTRLAETTIHDFPVTTLPQGSEKIMKRYSMLINQYAISKDAFDYWQLLRKTTENLGGLFDPLPSQVSGNIRSENNTSEPVLGYFSAGSVSTQRIFISLNDLPSYLRIPRSIGSCSIDSVLIADVKKVEGVAYLLITPYGVPFPIGYQYSSSNCVDCRAQGGTNVKPDFW